MTDGCLGTKEKTEAGQRTKQGICGREAGQSTKEVLSFFGIRL